MASSLRRPLGHDARSALGRCGAVYVRKASLRLPFAGSLRPGCERHHSQTRFLPFSAGRLPAAGLVQAAAIQAAVPSGDHSLPGARSTLTSLTLVRPSLRSQDTALARVNAAARTGAPSSTEFRGHSASTNANFSRPRKERAPLVLQPSFCSGVRLCTHHQREFTLLIARNDPVPFDWTQGVSLLCIVV
jgi:hypothetical protein